MYDYNATIRKRIRRVYVTGGNVTVNDILGDRTVAVAAAPPTVQSRLIRIYSRGLENRIAREPVVCVRGNACQSHRKLIVRKKKKNLNN